MKKPGLFILILLVLLSACQKSSGIAVTLLADGQSISLSTTERVPERLLQQAGISLGQNDRVLYLGKPVDPGQALPAAEAYTLSVRRAVEVTLRLPEGEQKLLTSALTVGEALEQAGIRMGAADRVYPPPDAVILPTNGETFNIEYQPARALTVSVDGAEIRLATSAGTVGEALAQAGMPLVGLDRTIPEESAPLPEDGRVRVVRVTESVALSEESIPFGSRTELSADLELDQQELLQGGEAGLKIARVRAWMEDGKQVSQMTDGESIVRPPQDRILGVGTKVTIKTATVDGVQIEYWRAMTLYATPYAPCIPETPTCRGGRGTASGTLVRKGEVAMVYPWYLLLAGERVYVPGYGFATVEDNNGAYTSAYWGTHWVDLGYPTMDDIDWVNGYVTVYFLTPVPANIASLYVMP